MKFKAKPEREKLEALIREGKKDTADLVKETGYSPQHIRKVRKAIKIKDAQPPKRVLKTPEEFKTVEKVQVTPTISTSPEIPTLEQAPSVILQKPEMKQQLTYLLQAGQITSLFNAINEMIPQAYRRSNEAMEMLGSVWEAPLNRILEEHLPENYDLIFAGIVTIVVFAPVPVQYSRDKQKKEQAKNQRPEPPRTQREEQERLEKGI